jgi:hypothetical protein
MLARARHALKVGRNTKVTDLDLVQSGRGALPKIVKDYAKLLQSCTDKVYK